VSAVADAPLRSAGSRRFAPPPGLAPHVVLDDERFVVASSEDLLARIDIAPAGSRGEAEQALARHLSAHPRDRGRLQVLPRHEAREAA